MQNIENKQNNDEGYEIITKKIKLNPDNQKKQDHLDFINNILKDDFDKMNNQQRSKLIGKSHKIFNIFCSYVVKNNDIDILDTLECYYKDFEIYSSLTEYNSKYSHLIKIVEHIKNTTTFVKLIKKLQNYCKDNSLEQKLLYNCVNSMSSIGFNIIHYYKNLKSNVDVVFALKMFLKDNIKEKISSMIINKTNQITEEISIESINQHASYNKILTFKDFISDEHFNQIIQMKLSQKKNKWDDHIMGIECLDFFIENDQLDDELNKILLDKIILLLKSIDIKVFDAGTMKKIQDIKNIDRIKNNKDKILNFDVFSLYNFYYAVYSLTKKKESLDFVIKHMSSEDQTSFLIKNVTADRISSIEDIVFDVYVKTINNLQRIFQKMQVGQLMPIIEDNQVNLLIKQQKDKILSDFNETLNHTIFIPVNLMITIMSFLKRPSHDFEIFNRIKRKQE